MLKQKKVKIKSFHLVYPETLNEKLNEAINQHNGKFNLICNDEKNTRIELVKDEERNVFFMTINRHKMTGIPVRYNENTMSSIEVEDGNYLGELYYAMINPKAGYLYGLSFLGTSLENSVHEALLFITDNPETATIKPEIDYNAYDNFKFSIICKSLNFKMEFNSKEDVDNFTSTPFGAKYSELLDYDNLNFEVKLSAGRRGLSLNKEILNITDEIINSHNCTKLIVKYLNEKDETVEIDLKKPKMVAESLVSYDDYLKLDEVIDLFIMTEERLGNK